MRYLQAVLFFPRKSVGLSAVPIKSIYIASFVETRGFAFSGANFDAERNIFQPQTTTYDYDAPMTEAGDPRPIKYAGIQNLIYEVSNNKLSE